MKALILIFLFILSLRLLGQSMDVETEKFCGVKKLTIESYNGDYAGKNYIAVYYFDDIGNAIYC